tara:strand:- start:2277 stop:2882 length:606 start_codon:yes stop_codon:yes gene_type:complete
MLNCKMLSTLKKLQTARVMLKARKPKKSGRNKFSGYDYYELDDFLPQTLSIFEELGLSYLETYPDKKGLIYVVDTGDKDAEAVVVEMPFSHANLRGCHEVQNVGAVMSYTQRYLWKSIMGLTDGDEVDESKGDPERPPELQRITSQQVTDIRAILKDISGDEAAFCKIYEVSALEEMPAHAHKNALARLNKRIKQLEESND